MEQIEGHLLLEKGLEAESVKIGIIDGGFLGAEEDPSLNHFFEKDLVAAYKDYIDPDAAAFGGSNALDDDHGTRVWQMIGGNNTENGVQFGLATAATYYLARTDHGSFEKRIEEDYLIAALEWMAGEGIRLVNISLGYATGFNDPSENYKVSDMDGKTSMIARAVDHAFFERDMLVVVAAGNEGLQKEWRVLSTPGDARGALTVGATKLNVWDKMDYSSKGPEFLDYLKPEVALYASGGTSFSAPVVTGLAAALMAYQPALSVHEIKSLIIESGNFFPYGNNFVGYGVPRVSAILKELAGEQVARPPLLKTRKSTVTLRGDYEGQIVVLYHKSDEVNVDHRIFLRPERNLIRIRKPDNINFTTVLLGKEVSEIVWLQ